MEVNMKYAIISRGDPFSDSVVQQLHERLKQIDMINNQENPHIVITVGGDGTMLKAVHHFIDKIDDVVFVGVHTGKLGFYTDYIPDDLESFIDKIAKDQYDDVSFPLLTAYVCRKNDCIKYNALNEITILNPFHTQHIDVYINDEYFESFQGTGLCISTPTGSSAFNKSLGGALIHPNIQAFQLTEIGSINNNVNRTISASMIFPKEQYITLKSTDFDEVTLTIDHMHRSIENFEYIKFVLSDKVVRFRQYHDNDFWKRVKKSFL